MMALKHQPTELVADTPAQRPRSFTAWWNRVELEQTPMEERLTDSTDAGAEGGPPSTEETHFTQMDKQVLPAWQE